MTLSTSDLETLELETGSLNSANCALLLCRYLVADYLINAKYLWKRTSTAIKNENEEITALWMLGKKLWAKDFAGFFSDVKQRQWSEGLAPLITELINKTRHRVFRLICLAYTTIRSSDLATLIDLPVEDAIHFATNPANSPEHLWIYDTASQMLEKGPAGLILASAIGSSTAANMGKHQRQFEHLTNYVSFLEN